MRLMWRLAVAVLLLAGCSGDDDDEARIVDLGEYDSHELQWGRAGGTDRLPIVLPEVPTTGDAESRVAVLRAGRVEPLPPLPTDLHLLVANARSHESGVLVSLAGCTEPPEAGDSVDWDCMAETVHELWNYDEAGWRRIKAPDTLLDLRDVIAGTAHFSTGVPPSERFVVDLTDPAATVTATDPDPLDGYCVGGHGTAEIAGPEAVELIDGGTTVVWTDRADASRRSSLPSAPRTTRRTDVDPWRTGYECGVLGSFMVIPGERDRTAAASERRYAVVDLRAASPSVEHFADTPEVFRVFGAEGYWGWSDPAGVHLSEGSVDAARVVSRSYADLDHVRAASDGVYLHHRLGDDTSVTFASAAPH